MKRTYFLVAIASLQIILGSITLIGAAQPIRTTQNVVVLSGNYYVFEFGILGTGRLSGNLSELQGLSFTLFVFNDAGYASFRDGSNSVAPLFEQSGTRVMFARISLARVSITSSPLTSPRSANSNSNSTSSFWG